jgi:hypothetical protein
MLKRSLAFKYAPQPPPAPPNFRLVSIQKKSNKNFVYLQKKTFDYEITWSFKKRLKSIRESLAFSQTAIINRWSSSDSFKIGVHRFLKNPSVSTSYLIEDICKTSHSVAGKHILCIADTSSADYNSHNGRFKCNDKSLGVIEDNRSTGIYAHASLGLDADTGLPLCYGFIKLWVHAFGRPKKEPYSHKQVPIEDKESYRWLEGVDASQKVFKEASMITAIHDRESDIYELFARIPNAHTHLLVRSSYERCVTSGGLLSTYIANQPVQGGVLLPIKATPTRTARVAKLEVRWSQVGLCKPKNKVKLLDKDPDQVEVYVVDVVERPESVPAGEAPIHWRLFTTHSVENLSQALQIVEWYSYRWWIEELFRLLKKDGFQIEKSQLSTGEALQKMIILCMDAALKVLTLKQARFTQEEQSADICFNESELECLTELAPKFEGRTLSQQNPHPISSLKWAAWIIARLGGWNPQGRDTYKRPPGVITFRRGLDRFYNIWEGWQLAQNPDQQKSDPSNDLTG